MVNEEYVVLVISVGGIALNFVYGNYCKMYAVTTTRKAVFHYFLVTVPLRYVNAH